MPACTFVWKAALVLTTNVEQRPPFFVPHQLIFPFLNYFSSRVRVVRLCCPFNTILSAPPVQFAPLKKKKKKKSHTFHMRDLHFCVKKKKYVYPHFSSSTRTNSCEELLFFFFSMFLTFATCALFHTMMVKIEKKTAERICALLKKKKMRYLYLKKKKEE